MKSVGLVSRQIDNILKHCLRILFYKWKMKTMGILLTGLHPLHGLHKYWRAFRFLICSLWVISFVPFEALLTLTLFMRNYVLLRGNNSSTSFAAVNNLWFLISFHILFANWHVRDLDVYWQPYVLCEDENFSTYHRICCMLESIYQLEWTSCHFSCSCIKKMEQIQGILHTQNVGKLLLIVKAKKKNIYLGITWLHMKHKTNRENKMIGKNNSRRWTTYFQKVSIHIKEYLL